MKEPKIMIGWEEWCSFPDLGLIAVKAKIDTGATTSSLHAFNIEPYLSGDGVLHVRFHIHPLQRLKDFVRVCTAPVVDKRVISDSGGHREERYIIKTLLSMADHSWDIELSLTDRDSMRYRMLLGRKAMKRKIIVNPGKSFILGRCSNKKALISYLGDSEKANGDV